MLRAIVIHPNQKVRDMGSLLAIARAEAQKREHTHENVLVKTIKFVSELDVYVAIYEGCSKTPGVRRKEKMTFG